MARTSWPMSTMRPACFSAVGHSPVALLVYEPAGPAGGLFASFSAAVADDDALYGSRAGADAPIASSAY